MARIPTLLRTLWYLRPEQWRGQAERALGRQWRRVRLSGPPPKLCADRGRVAFLPAPPHVAWDGADRLQLIGRELDLSRGIPWTGAPHGPLFTFHLHQLDWLRIENVAPDARWRVTSDWIDRHPEGIGWHPANASLRTFTWTKLLMTPGAFPDGTDTAPLRAVVADQVATIERHPETLLLANHYLWNLLALAVAGVAFDGAEADRWLAAAAPLAEQLAEQVPSDGLHYERSPMYHSQILENVLDVLNADDAVGGRLPAPLRSALTAAAARMRTALTVVTHPDGGIALFGDSAFGVAQPPAALHAYADAIGIEPASPAVPGALADSGYARLEAGPYTLIAGASPPMPDYQPGHAHCDALSFELSVGSQRVVTDTGVYEYVAGERRTRARATASHATIEIEGHEQSEVWSAHRVGGRADAGLVHVDPPHRFEGVCAGYATPEVLHRRRIDVQDSGIEIEDSLDGPARHATLVLPLAPGLEPELTGTRASIALESDRLEIDLPEIATWRVARAPYYPEFGREEDRAVLLGEAQELTTARWRLRRVPA